LIKILWVNANPNPNPGGTEIHSIDFINELEKIEDIQLYKAVAKGSYVDKHISERNKFNITLKSEFSPLNTIKLINLARKIKPDFIIGNNGNEYINTFLAGKLSGAKIILFRHMLNYQPFFIKKFILPNVYKIIAVSESSKRRLIKDGIKEEKIEVLYNFIDEDRFYPDNEKRDKIRKQFNIKDDEIVILFVGKVDKGKGIYDFIEIADKLEGNVKFIVVGDGKDLENAKKLLKNKEKVIFTGYRKDTEYFYNASDIVLVLSKGEESFGRTAVEGIATGKVVFVYDIENLKYLFENEKSGFIVKNKEEAIKKLKEIINNKDLMKEISENALKLFKEKYSKKIILNKFINLLKESKNPNG